MPADWRLLCASWLAESQAAVTVAERAMPNVQHRHPVKIPVLCFFVNLPTLSCIHCSVRMWQWLVMGVPAIAGRIFFAGL
jgi:hypothetical protein